MLHKPILILWCINDDVFFQLNLHVMSGNVVALVIWLYFTRIINYYAPKVKSELKLRGRTETEV